VGLVGSWGADSQCPWFGSLPELPHVRKRSRANKAKNCFLYCPFSDRGNSAIRLQTDEIKSEFLRAACMPVFSHRLGQIANCLTIEPWSAVGVDSRPQP